jgi:hypothetical protein
VHQIAAVSGHVSLKEVERYTKKADQRRLAREALGEQNASESVKSDPPEVSNPLNRLAETTRLTIKLNRLRSSFPLWSMILSENLFPLFLIMLFAREEEVSP